MHQLNIKDFNQNTDILDDVPTIATLDFDDFNDTQIKLLNDYIFQNQPYGEIAIFPESGDCVKSGWIVVYFDDEQDVLNFDEILENIFENC